MLCARQSSEVLTRFAGIRSLSTNRRQKERDYVKCYETLLLKNGADQESVRTAFINLCKRYHPDSGTTEADVTKFQEIETAYRTLQDKFADERWNVNECVGEYGLYYHEKKKADENVEPEIFDIKHTAPQHRQYLSYEGVGVGNPSQRERQYAKHRTNIAVQRVYEHRVSQLSEPTLSQQDKLVVKDKEEARKVKTRAGMDRLVEDLILESMARGEFENLSGVGKPLKHDTYNPYVDLVTQKVNQVLIENGFVPEWVTLNKDIRAEIQSIKELLVKERSMLGVCPLSERDEKTSRMLLERLKERQTKLNSNINKFNLLVPLLNRQMVHFNVKKQWEETLKTSPAATTTPTVKSADTIPRAQNRNGFLGIFNIFFPGN